MIKEFPPGVLTGEYQAPLEIYTSLNWTLEDFNETVVRLYTRSEIDVLWAQYPTPGGDGSDLPFVTKLGYNRGVRLHP